MDEASNDLSDFQFDEPSGPEPGAQSATDEAALETFSRLLGEVEAESPKPMLRKGTYSDPLPRMTAVDKMIDFINTTRRLPVERIEERLVNESMPVMLWKLREFALGGKYTEARAVEIWLAWANKILARPKKRGADPNVASGALFDARLTRGDVIPAQASPVPEKKTAGKKQPKAFSHAGVFIGRDKKPAKEKTK